MIVPEEFEFRIITERLDRLTIYHAHCDFLFHLQAGQLYRIPAQYQSLSASGKTRGFHGTGLAVSTRANPARCLSALHRLRCPA